MRRNTDSSIVLRSAGVDGLPLTETPATIGPRIASAIHEARCRAVAQAQVALASQALHQGVQDIAVGLRHRRATGGETHHRQAVVEHHRADLLIAHLDQLLALAQGTIELPENQPLARQQTTRKR